ncbi:MAG TPA: oligosaccharide flippase family protein, partial [Pyrinomonadaceae bacterium]|nr:oligosaccharide flippase family protein [Pyrinomonadaceae bacterium]
MIARSARLIFLTDTAIILSTMISSLVGARALGPAGRGDLLIVVLWPPVVAMLAAMGLPTAYRYWMAKEPERVSRLFSNAVVYTVIVGLVSVTIADIVVPHLVGSRSEQVMTLVRLYQINIPAALFLNLMRGLLEGTRRFGWAGLARLLSFVVQGPGFALLWMLGHLTVASATYTLIVAQTLSTLLGLFAVYRELRPRWQPDWTEFKTSMNYGLRDYPGSVADFTTLRLDQLMLGAMASNVAIGLYVIAVRLSEMTTLLADAIADALMPEVAAAERADRAEALTARSLRLAIYMHLLLLGPLWIAAPFMLRLLFGEGFVPATGAFRWLLLAAGVWSCGSIVVSGLRGFGHPGVSTVAKFSAAVVTSVALILLLPRWGIIGAAISSLVGYSVMLGIALFGFAKTRQLRLWQNCLRPQRRDVFIPNWRTLLGIRGNS